MANPNEPRQTEGGDPGGFLLFIVLLAIFGGAILFAVRWVVGLFETAG